LAYHAALKELTRNRAAPQWVGTQFNLASCIAALAERTADPTSLLVEAIAHMQNAVDGFRQVGDKYWGPIAEQRLAELKAKAK
jgi:hypothetical protein